jgi:hypothetical protein
MRHQLRVILLLLNGAAEAEAGDNFAVAIDIVTGEVVEEPSALAHHLEEAAARMMIVLMLCKVCPEVVDAGGQNSYLNFRGTCIALVRLKIGDKLLLAFGLQSQLRILLRVLNAL